MLNYWEILKFSFSKIQQTPKVKKQKWRKKFRKFIKNSIEGKQKSWKFSIYCLMHRVLSRILELLTGWLRFLWILKIANTDDLIAVLQIYFILVLCNKFIVCLSVYTNSSWSSGSPRRTMMKDDFRRKNSIKSKRKCRLFWIIIRSLCIGVFSTLTGHIEINVKVFLVCFTFFCPILTILPHFFF